MGQCGVAMRVRLAGRTIGLWLALLWLPLSATAYELTELGGKPWRVESVSVSRLASYRGVTDLRWNATQLMLDPRSGGELPGRFRLRLSLSTGALRDPADAVAGSFITFGPEFQRPWAWNGLAGQFSFGVSPTLLSQDEFEGQRLGGNFYFTSAVVFGVFLDARRSLLLNYRIQHTSNAHLNRENPGLDVLGLELRYYGRRR